MAYMSNRLASEKVIVSAPTSFSGSAQRIWKITNTSNPMLKWFVLAPIAICLIIGVWMLVFMWYIVIFGLFGIFVIPFRFLTRSGRYNKRSKLQHRELLEAIRDGKMNKTAE